MYNILQLQKKSTKVKTIIQLGPTQKTKLEKL